MKTSQELTVGTGGEQTEHLDAQQDSAFKKRGYKHPVESSENTTFDFHVAIFCLMIGVICGLILSIKLSAGPLTAISRPTPPTIALYKPFAEIPTDPTVESSSDPVVPEVTAILVCPDYGLAEWSSSSEPLCPHNETMMATQEESSAAAPIGDTNYSLTILQEMEGYSIDGFIYSLYHSVLGSL